MAKYCKHPVIVDAIQYTDDNRQQIATEFRGVRPVAFSGDWIIRDAAGVFSVCSPEEFAATYEPVDAQYTRAWHDGFKSGVQHVATDR